MNQTQDELTGLCNRHGFLSQLGRHVHNANDHGRPLALIVVDIDNFVQINSAGGYALGDDALRHLARQLQSVARDQDIVARLGDNRFALLLPQVRNRGHAELAIQKLFRLLQSPLQAGDARLTLPVTVGVALFPEHASQAEHLLGKAELALATARVEARHYLFAPDDPQAQTLSWMWDMEMALDGAIERGEMQMHYQPKIRSSDLRIIGAEALMRWRRPSHGEVSPDVFIPLAERSGRIKQLTLWALNTALRQAGEWNPDQQPFEIAVNLPGELTLQRDLPELLENALQLWGKDKLQLVLEITERSLMDRDHAMRVLSQIRNLGVQVSIDDFGTGYSCLAYFKNIPADELKIDQSFVQGLLTDTASADITTLIIDLAHRFGLKVAAEGVEVVETFDMLKRGGCDIVQGYLFGRPMPASSFGDLLDSYDPGAVPVMD